MKKCHSWKEKTKEVNAGIKHHDHQLEWELHLIGDQRVTVIFLHPNLTNVHIFTLGGGVKTTN